MISSAGARRGPADPAAIDYVKWVQLDTPMMLIIVALLASVVVGLAMAFPGLAYHHERRHYERYRPVGATRESGFD